jgi:hypothetical protein
VVGLVWTGLRVVERSDKGRVAVGVLVALTGAAGSLGDSMSLMYSSSSVASMLGVSGLWERKRLQLGGFPAF